MNRRRKKKQQVDYVEVFIQKLVAIDWKQPFNKNKWLQRIQPIEAFWLRLPKFHQRALVVLVPVLLLLLIVPFPRKVEVLADGQGETDSPRVSVPLNARSLSQQHTTKNSSPKVEEWREYQVKDGDTLAQVFRGNQLSMADLNDLVKIEGSDKPLSYIKPGQLIRFKLSENGQLDMLQLEKSDHSVMFFRLSDGSFGRNK